MTVSAAANEFIRWKEHPDQFVQEIFGVTPDAWQLEVLQAFPHNQRIAMKAPLCLENRVDTPDGRKRWGDIKRGDNVFAEDGSITKVLERYDAGEREVYRVKFRDGSWVDACGEHLWKIQTAYDRKVGKYRELSTNDILQHGLKIKTGQRFFNIPIQGVAEYPEKKLPLDPYVFGLWIGDGSRNEPSIICPDVAIRNELEARGFEISLKKNGKTIRILNSVKYFRGTGINDLYCYEKYIPDEYKYSSKEQRQELLRGMMDADGTVAKNQHTYYAASSERLVDDIMWLARSLGYLSNKLGPYKINNGENRDSYRAVITGALCPFSAETSKKLRWKPPAKFRYTRYIESIESVGKKECMCIKIAHSSSCFLANDFIVTHNCKGPGKTAVEAWLAWNFLLTRPYPKIAATSITGANLADNLWSEMSKWQQKSELLKSSFTWTKTRIFLNESPETWWMSARPWSKSADVKEQGDTLAGLHADYIMFVLDESGGIPESVAMAAEAALSSCLEGHILQGGNPSDLKGMLYKSCTRDRKLWFIVEITSDPMDPKRTPRVSIEWAQSQIDAYGRDNPYVMVNILGKFPSTAFNALIGVEEVEAAMKRSYRESEYRAHARILGCDIARGGLDKSVIYPRQGLQAFNPSVYRNIDGTQGANHVARKWQEWDVDACFIDDTGGFGSSWLDNLSRLGFGPIGVHFSEKSGDPRFFNKRTEIIFALVEWIKRGGALPYSAEMIASLTETTYTHKGDSLIIEPKEMIKERLGYSPDEMDALALTFSQPVIRQSKLQQNKGAGFRSNYNPLSMDYVKKLLHERR